MTLVISLDFFKIIVELLTLVPYKFSKFKSAVQILSFSCSSLVSIVDKALLAIALAFSTSVAYKLKNLKKPFSYVFHGLYLCNF